MAVAENPDRPPELLSIGQLAERTGVARTALRYYDELGLVRPATRPSGRRRYTESAVKDLGVICFLREVGFSLSEIGAFLSAGKRRLRDQIIADKITQLAEQQHRLEVALTALEHGQRCPAEDPAQCPRFWSIIEGHRDGLSLEDSHNQAHQRGSPPSDRSHGQLR
ncbi:MAG: MerR family transcriptional regulator [Sciscionella sp.]